ncbi:MAG: glycosyltransferase, partial [Cyanobacteria bacterium J06600_6]
MKILHLATADIEGGAARAAYRLHQGLRHLGVNSQMLVRGKSSVDSKVMVERNMLTKVSPILSTLPLKRYPGSEPILFSSQWFPDTLASRVAEIKPDVVNLQWIRNGFLQIETLAKLKIPLVWTLHDMWAFTGGCHYATNCNKYQHHCGACPSLKSDRQQDLSRRIWQRKAKAWREIDLTVVSPSKWLAECAKKSSLFKDRKIEVIPHGLDLTSYQAINQQQARQILHLPADKQLILFGSSTGAGGEYRKGFHLLKPALLNLIQSGWQEQIELVVFGGSKTNKLDIPLKTHHLGQFKDDISLALVYAA